MERVSLVKEHTVDRLAHKASEVMGSRKAKRNYRDMESEMDGWLYRETSVQGLMNKRYGALYSTAFVTYRKEDTNVPPTKNWTLEEGCALTPNQKVEILVRHKGNSTLWAIARGHMSKSVMWGFTVRFPPGNPHYRDLLRLCFEDETTAMEWHTSFARVIGCSSATPRSLSDNDAHRRSGAADMEAEDDDKEALLPRTATATPPHEGLPGPTLEQIRQYGSLSDHIRERWDTMEDDGPEEGPPKWASLRHINGVTVYQEAGSGDQQGAYMVSAAVCATPREVFSVLAALGKRTPLAFKWQIVERLDANTRVIKSTIPPKGIAGMLCAPREAVVQQAWREVEDGTIILLGSSTEHSSVPLQEKAWSWIAPVRAKVESAGFTLAPLQSRYMRGHEESPTCLVTFVLKVDLGGWLSDRSWARALFQPWYKLLANAFLEPLLMSVIALRDTVEQSRFVVQPFMMAPSPEASSETAAASMLKGKTSRQLKPLTSIRKTAVEFPEEAEEDEARHEAIEEEEEEEDPDFPNTLDAMTQRATLDEKFWTCPGAVNFNVRGPNYLKDRKKVPAGEPIFSLASCDLVSIGRRPYHVAPELPCIRHSKAPFNFLLNLMVPGPQKLALVITWAAEQAPMLSSRGSGGASERASSVASQADSDSDAGSAPFDILLARFMAGDDEAADRRRDGIFKLIPSVVKGSWVIKQSVGHTPVVLGRKLKTQYHRGANYFEVDVDVGSSRAANTVVGMVQGATTSMIIDMAVVLEGHSEEELPECLLGTVRFEHLNMKAFKVLEPNSNGSQPGLQKKTQ